MQREILLGLLFFSGFTVLACDVCGGGLGSNFIGIAAQTTNTMVGFRFSNTTISTKHLAIFRDEKTYYSAENYSTLNIWARFYLHKKIQVYTFVPLHYYFKKENNVAQQNYGVGDATIRLHYMLYNNIDNSEKTHKHSLQAGIGIKLPTGYHEKKQNDTLLPIGMQLGSGSFDIPLAAIYNYRWKQWGLNVESAYNVNFVNNVGYKFGDRWNNTLAVYYWKKFRKVNYVPKVQMTMDWTQKDKKNKVSQSATGGAIIKAGAGLDIFFGKASVGAGFELPIYDKINGGLSKTKATIYSQFIYLF